MDNKAELSRAAELLRACMALLNKQKDSPRMLNMLEQTVFYDGTQCDGYCLSEDIEMFLADCIYNK